ncbi:MAG: TIGR03546 family protein [Bdellovibrionales bacterium]
MTLLLKQIFAFFKLLNSDTGTNQLAAGITCGVILGFTPAFSLQTILVFFCLFFFRIQIGAAFVTAFFFKFLAFLFDPAFHAIGVQVLAIDSLKPMFTTLYNMPIIPYTRFNNTIVMGSAVVTIILSPIVFIASKILIRQYRAQVVARLQETKIWKFVKATYFYKWYAKYDELFGN